MTGVCSVVGCTLKLLVVKKNVRTLTFLRNRQNNRSGSNSGRKFWVTIQSSAIRVLRLPVHLLDEKTYLFQHAHGHTTASASLFAAGANVVNTSKPPTHLPLGSGQDRTSGPVPFVYALLGESLEPGPMLAQNAMDDERSVNARHRICGNRDRIRLDALLALETG